MSESSESGPGKRPSGRRLSSEDELTAIDRTRQAAPAGPNIDHAANTAILPEAEIETDSRALPEIDGFVLEVPDTMDLDSAPPLTPPLNPFETGQFGDLSPPDAAQSPTVSATRLGVPPPQPTTGVRASEPKSQDADEPATVVWQGGMAALITSEDGRELIGERYVNVAPLGVGGMGKVLKVRHAHINKEFALKIIHEDLTSDTRVLNRFFSEARVISSVDHPGVVQIVDFGIDPKVGAYLVMELLKGETLKDRLKREGKLPVNAALDVAMQVAEVLHHLHQSDFIHCDVKPDNVFLCRPPPGQRRRPTVKLIDFGLSRMSAVGAFLARQEVAGTPHYMAPEQIKGAAPTAAMDIYSLGVILYQMITGKLPFEGSVHTVIRDKLEEQPPNPSDQVSQPVDLFVEGLVIKALAKDPALRPQSMGQVIYQIRTFMEMQGVTPHRRTTGTQSVLARKVAQNVETEELRIIFETCPCPLFLLDTEGSISRTNPAFDKFVNQSEKELLGQPMEKTRLRYVYPDFREDFEDMQQTVKYTSLSRRLSFVVDPETGATIEALFVLVPHFDERGHVSHFVGTIYNLGSQ